MSSDQELFKVFLTMHNKKTRTTKEPVAYLVQKNDCLKSDTPLVAWKEHHLVDYFDHDSKQFQWLMKFFHIFERRLEKVTCFFFCKISIFNTSSNKKNVSDSLLHV